MNEHKDGSEYATGLTTHVQDTLSPLNINLFKQSPRTISFHLEQDRTVEFIHNMGSDTSDGGLLFARFALPQV